MKFRWQNLKERADRYWLHGRAWFGTWRTEWVVWNSSFRLGLEFDDGENEICVTFGIWLFCLYISKRVNLFRIREGREFYLYWFENAVWFKVWGGDDYHRRDPWWKKGIAFHVDDFLLGKPSYSEETIEERNTFVPMPEGCYPISVKFHYARWVRARWFTREMKRATIDVLGGVSIPHEGKGENSWDCGEDGLRGLTCQADTIEDAIGKLVASCLRDRKRYGGKYQHRDLPVVYVPTH